MSEKKTCETCVHIEVCSYCHPQLPICDSYEPKERHGRWVIGLDGSYMCSQCGRVFRYDIGNYCSNCGVRLILED